MPVSVPDSLVLTWKGPYAPASVLPGDLPLSSLPTGGGVYLWTAAINGVPHVIEVGQTVGLRSYLSGHRTKTRQGEYYIYDPVALGQGRVVTVHRNTRGGPMLSGVNLADIAERFLSTVRFYVAEVPDPTPGSGQEDRKIYSRLLKRVEAGVAAHIAMDPSATAIFAPTRSQYYPRREGESRITVHMAMGQPIAGLAGSLQA
ncbi:MAG: hypothetical protein Q8P50_14585 [Bacillota bacterium]|nr:hypothetical protein [Bacillota bacterium]